MAIRKVPMPPRPATEPHWHGLCRWCCKPILHPEGHKRAGERNTNRSWCGPCVSDYKLHAFPQEQRWWVGRRDGERCWTCGAEPMRWLRDRFVTHCYNSPDYRGEKLGPYCGVQWVSALELDHTAPLWSVQHLEDDLRRWFYGPDNLRLLCPDHHKAKTALEAARRGLARRLVKQPDHRPSCDLLWAAQVEEFV